MSSSDTRVRCYQEGDERRIVPFLERCMAWPAVRSQVDPLDHWRWKFLGNPLGFHLVCVAEQGGAVVSHSASLPVEMRVGSRTIIASQGVDLCTDPNCRGHGLIGRTMKCRNDLKDEHGVALDFGFPNQAAYHISMMKQGFRDMGITMLQYRFITDEDQFFSKVRFGSIKRLGYDSFLLLKRSFNRRDELAGGLTIEATSSFGPEVDELSRRSVQEFDLMIVREHTYLNWRYADPRAGQFIIRTARKDGRLVGYLVHKKEEREGTRFLNVVDALVDPRFEDVLEALLIDTIGLARELGIETILCCLPDGHPYHRYLLELGFLPQVRYTGDQPMSVIYLDRNKEGTLGGLITKGGLRPHLTLGDTDWV